MVTRRTSIGLLAALALGGVPLGSPMAAARRHVVFTWNLDWSGWSVGDLRLSVTFVRNQAFSEVRARSRGLAALLTGFEGRSDALTHRPPDARPVPLSYDSHYETKRYTRTVRLRFADREVSELATWKRDQLQRSRVPRRLWTGCVDPLTSILDLHRWFERVRSAGPRKTEISVFDGRRRYDVRAEFLEAGVERGQPIDRLRLELLPVAGFSDGDPLARWATGGSGDRWIEAVIGRGLVPVPLRLQTRGGSLGSSLRLRESCVDGACTTY